MMNSNVTWDGAFLRVLRTVIVAALALGSATVAAQVPHTFTGGTPAKAAEVNANFAYVVERLVPVGSVMAFAGATAPAGWLLCDGAEVSRAEYPALFAVLGVAHGGGDLVTSFNLPDYRGRFLRGVDGGAGRDPNAATRAAMASNGSTGDAVGSVQDDAFQNHQHLRRADGAAEFTSIAGSGQLIDTGGAGGIAGTGAYGSAATVGGATAGYRSSAETRPVNAAVNFIIKY